MKSSVLTKALIFCALPAVILSTDLKPWPDTDFQFQGRISNQLQYYRTIRTPCKTIRHHEFDSFTTLSIAMSGLDYNGELETTIANTRHQPFDVDNLRLTARYRLMNDIVGDFLSSMVGFTITQAFKHSVHDISSFHHAQFETELHASIGKEYCNGNRWQSRWWGVLGYAVGDTGSPWLHGYFAWEKNWCDWQTLRLYVNGLYGFGHNNLHRFKHFEGYGGIAHRSIDIGARYSYTFEFDATLSFEYAYRAYALNFPSHTNLIWISFLYPFSL